MMSPLENGLGLAGEPPMPAGLAAAGNPFLMMQQQYLAMIRAAGLGAGPKLPTPLPTSSAPAGTPPGFAPLAFFNPMLFLQQQQQQAATSSPATSTTTSPSQSSPHLFTSSAAGPALNGKPFSAIP